MEKARAIQRERFKDTSLRTNSDSAQPPLVGWARRRSASLCPSGICPLDETSTNLVKTTMQQMHLSARAYHRILKLARTIADLAAVADIQSPHIAEAIQSHREAAHYRPRRVI